MERRTLKNKLIDTLGNFGFVIWILISFIFPIFPLIFLGFSFWVDIIIIIAMNSIPFVGDAASVVIWVWALIEVISGPQDAVAIAYYVAFLIKAILIIQWFALLIMGASEKKELTKKADEDAQIIYQKVNSILHLYSTGLSYYEMIAYYTLTVAIGHLSGEYADEELKYLRNKLYFSNILGETPSPANRGMLGIRYDKLLSEHEQRLSDNSALKIADRVRDILAEHNQIFPETPRPNSQDHVDKITAIITE